MWKKWNKKICLLHPIFRSEQIRLNGVDQGEEEDMQNLPGLEIGNERGAALISNVLANIVYNIILQLYIM